MEVTAPQISGAHVFHPNGKFPIKHEEQVGPIPVEDGIGKETTYIRRYSLRRRRRRKRLQEVRKANFYVSLFPMKPSHRANALQAFASLRASQSPKLPLNDVHHFIDARIIKTGFNPQTCRFNFRVNDFLQRGELSHARQLFDQMPQKNTISTNMMISGYVKSGNLSYARELFDAMVERTAVTWTILIGGYSQSNQFREAFKLFAAMCRWGTEPDYITFATLLSGCSESETANEVVQVHAHVVKLGFDSTLMVCNSLVDAYCKTRCLDLACQLFQEMPERDCVTLNAMITGFSRGGMNEDAIKLFMQMQRFGFKPSEFTFAAVLCAGIGLDDIVFGQQIHSFVVKTNFVWNVFVGNALLDFYSKHSRVLEARKFFDEMPELDGVSYNVIISGYAWDGKIKESLDLFRELQYTRFDRRQFPLATLLSIAANTLDLEMGRQIHSQAIVSTADSEVLVGNSLVDVYAKCGRFEEAKKIFANLAHKSTVPWTAMISGYVQKGLHEESLKLFNEMRRTNKAAGQLFSMEELRDAAPYVNMSNIYAAVGQWDNVGKVKKAMRDRGVKKVPAYSWVEIEHKNHVFSANDKSHPQMGDIMRKIDMLAKQMEKEGYKPDTSCALHNVDEEIKAESLKYHSERLAIAYALISTPEGSPILVMKNLRACTDCHAAIKLRFDSLFFARIDYQDRARRLNDKSLEIV
ncbi:hypothetical protein SO802_001723 [Lithocarpus litseifolius]|uniref:DYW domain-containing protein n=1 Tax=Lithocarpus litseifolius TaxID=425828 RepID=A0AAW2DX35_9ROSI